MRKLSYNFHGALRKCRILYDSEVSFLIAYDKVDFPFSAYVSVCRTSRQYYRVTALISFYDLKYTYIESFRNVELTALYIDKILRR